MQFFIVTAFFFAFSVLSMVPAIGAEPNPTAATSEERIGVDASMSLAERRRACLRALNAFNPSLNPSATVEQYRIMLAAAKEVLAIRALAPSEEVEVVALATGTTLNRMAPGMMPPSRTGARELLPNYDKQREQTIYAALDFNAAYARRESVSPVRVLTKAFYFTLKSPALAGLEAETASTDFILNNVDALVELRSLAEFQELVNLLPSWDAKSAAARDATRYAKKKTVAIDVALFTLTLPELEQGDANLLFYDIRERIPAKSGRTPQQALSWLLKYKIQRPLTTPYDKLKVFDALKVTLGHYPFPEVVTGISEISRSAWLPWELRHAARAFLRESRQYQKSIGASNELLAMYDEALDPKLPQIASPSKLINACARLFSKPKLTVVEP